MLYQIFKTKKLLRSTKSKTTKNENGENIPFLEITDVVLIDCNIVINDYQQVSTVFAQKIFVKHLVLINLLVSYPIFNLKNFIFLKPFNSEFS